MAIQRFGDVQEDLVEAARPSLEAIFSPRRKTASMAASAGSALQRLARPGGAGPYSLARNTASSSQHRRALHRSKQARAPSEGRVETQHDNQVASSSSHPILPPSPTVARRTSSRVALQGGQKHRKRPLTPQEETVKDNYRHALQRKDANAAFKAWNVLQATAGAPSGIGVISVEDTLLLSSLVEQKHGFDRHRLLAIAIYILKQNGKSQSLSRCLAAFFRHGQEEEALQFAIAVLQSEQFQCRQADGHLWQIASQLVAAACLAASKNSPLELIKIARSLPSFPIAGRNRDSMDGCPVSLPITRNSLELLTNDVKERQDSYSLCEHVMMAWSLDYSINDEKKTTSIAGRIASMAGRRDWEGIHCIIDRGRQARRIWLRATTGSEEADWNDLAWSVLLTAVLADRQTDLANKSWSFFSEVKGSDQKITSRVWNALLTGYARARDYDSLVRTWQDIQNHPEARDWYTIATMINALFRLQKTDEALLLFEEAKADAKKRRVELPVEVLNVTLLGLCINRRRENAFVIFDDMVKGEGRLPRPNVVSVNTILRAYGRMGDLDKIGSLLDSLPGLGLEADQVTYTTVLDAMIRSGKHENVGRVVESMKAKGVTANAITLTALLKSYLGGGGASWPSVDQSDEVRDEDTFRSSEERFDLAFQLLDFMEVQGPTPTEITYTAIMASLFRNPELFRSYMAQGLLPEAYSTPRRDAAPQAEQLYMPNDWKSRPEAAVAMMLFRRLQKRRLSRNQTTYNTLISGLLQLPPDALNLHPNVILRSVDDAIRLLRMSMGSRRDQNSQTWILTLELLIVRCKAYRDRPAGVFVKLCDALARVVAMINSKANVEPSRRLINELAEAQAIIKEGAASKQKGVAGAQ